jgi:hypothetical protein
MCKWHTCLSQTLIPLVSIILVAVSACAPSYGKPALHKKPALKKMEAKVDFSAGKTAAQGQSEVNESASGAVYAYFIGKGVDAYKQNDFLVAEHFFQIALEDAQIQKLDKLQQAMIMTNLASVQRDAHKYAEAEKLFKRALEIEKQDLQTNKRALEYTANQYIAMLRKAGRNGEAWMLEVSLRDGFKSKKCIACEESLAKTIQQERLEAAAKQLPVLAATKRLRQPKSSPQINPSHIPDGGIATNPPHIFGGDGNPNNGPQIPGADGIPNNSPQIAGGDGNPNNNYPGGPASTVIIQQPYTAPAVYGMPVVQMAPGADPHGGTPGYYPIVSPLSPVTSPRQPIPLRAPVGNVTGGNMFGSGLGTGRGMFGR